MAAKARTGCQLCRIKHLKCDQGTPKCGRCEASGNECIRGFTYRFHREAFSDDQKWLAMPNELTFVDETKGLPSSSDCDSFSEYVTPPPENRSTDATSAFSTPTADAILLTQPENAQVLQVTGSEASDYNQSTSATASLASPFTHGLWDDSITSKTSNLSHEAQPLLFSNPLTIEGLLNKHGTDDSHQKVPRSYQHNAESLLLPPIYSEEPVWPLTNPEEALLLGHFVQNLAIWLDLCDPLRHFQVEVPRRAGSCQILLNAIFALSARHLSRTRGYDPIISNHYHNECLKYLRPMLNDSSTVSDEGLFAATIILRVMEEMDAPELDSQGHILGIQVFAGARDPYTMPGGLSEAAFWVGLRQEIYSAMMKHQSTQLDLEHCSIDRSFDPTSDYGWANRAIVHCADVLNCCFGETGVSTRHWEELKRYGEQWHKKKPPSFIPYYRRDPDRGKKEAFPEIRYLNPCHIISVQHWLLAKILLAIFDPKLPRIGGNRTAAVRSMESEVERCLRQLCGIGLSNLETAPAIFTASMGIAICGDRMTDRIDQEALLDLLRKTENDHARPTKAVQQQMKESWGWMSDD